MPDTIAEEKERLLRETESEADSITVGTTPVEIMPANPDRKAYLIYNNGAQAAVIDFDSSVSPTKSVPLASGASLDGDDYKGAFYARTSSGTTNIRFMEVC